MHPTKIIAVHVKIIDCAMNPSITPTGMRPVAAGTISYIRNALKEAERVR
jgi:hypothetical protein